MYQQEVLERALVRFNAYRDSCNSDNPHNIINLMTFLIEEAGKICPNAVIMIASESSFLINLPATAEEFKSKPHEAFVVPISPNGTNRTLDVQIGFAVLSVIEYIVANRMPHDPITFWFCPDTLHLNLAQIHKEVVSSWDMLCTLNSDCIQFTADGMCEDPSEDFHVNDIPAFIRTVIRMIER